VMRCFHAGFPLGERQSPEALPLLPLLVSQFLDRYEVDPQGIPEYSSFRPRQSHSPEVHSHHADTVGRGSIATLFKAPTIAGHGARSQLPGPAYTIRQTPSCCLGRCTSRSPPTPWCWLSPGF